MLICLDPDANHKDPKLLQQRYIVDSSKLYQSRDIDSIDIANKIPVNIDFYPSDETIRKLIMRAAQIKTVEKDLWPGFSVVEGKEEITFYYAELIEPYEVNE